MPLRSPFEENHLKAFSKSFDQSLLIHIDRQQSLDKRIKRALSIANNISFYRYRINFELTKSSE